MSTEQPKVAIFRKGKSRPTTTRKRSASPPAPSTSMGASSSKTQVILPSKKAATNLLSAGTKRKISERDDDAERDGPDVKWSAAASHQQAAMDILAGDELEELEEKKRLRTMPDNDNEDNDGPDDRQYRGQKAYRSHLQKSKDVPKAMRVGPQRNASTIRTVTIVDYQPDVCKDYKETGFCGFGDTCKFLHDRGTYLQGWQLDKLAENPKKQVGDDSDSDSDSDDEDVPFACLICRKHYTDPIVTRCGHYFCSACAIKRFAKTPKCSACGAPTGGMFNRADKIIAKIEKKRKEKEGEQDDASGDEGGAVQIEGLEEKKRQVDSDSDGDSDDSDE